MTPEATSTSHSRGPVHSFTAAGHKAYTLRDRSEGGEALGGNDLRRLAGALHQQPALGWFDLGRIESVGLRRSLFADACEVAGAHHPQGLGRSRRHERENEAQASGEAITHLGKSSASADRMID
jgi:hypothetical protein